MHDHKALGFDFPVFGQLYPLAEQVLNGLPEDSKFVCYAHEEETWLEARKKVVTGTAAASLLGLGQYALSEDEMLANWGASMEDAPPLWWGRRMELPNLHAFYDITAPSWECVMPFNALFTRGPLGATTDSLGLTTFKPGLLGQPQAVRFPHKVEYALSCLSGEKAALIEMKNLSRPFTGGKVPENYAAQVILQMHVTGIRDALLVSKVGSCDMHVFHVEYDDFLMEELEEKATRFLKRVKAKYGDI